MQALTEAPILARADGYLKRRSSDIGDRVHAGPGAGRNRRAGTGSADPPGRSGGRAGAGRDRAGAGEPRAGQSEPRSRAHHRGTAEDADAQRGISPQQEGDQSQAQLAAQDANVQALEKAISAQRSNLAARQSEPRAAAGGPGLSHWSRRRSTASSRCATWTSARSSAPATRCSTGSRKSERFGPTSTFRRASVNVGARRPAGRADACRIFRAARFRGTVARTAQRARSGQPHDARRSRRAECGRRAVSRHLRRSRSERHAPATRRSSCRRRRSSSAPTARRSPSFEPDDTVHLQKITVGRDYGDRVEILQAWPRARRSSPRRRRRARRREDRSVRSREPAVDASTRVLTCARDRVMLHCEIEPEDHHEFSPTH